MSELSKILPESRASEIKFFIQSLNRKCEDLNARIADMQARKSDLQRELAEIEHVCGFSDAWTQEYPRKCTGCGAPEPEQQAAASAKLEKMLGMLGKVYKNAKS